MARGIGIGIDVAKAKVDVASSDGSLVVVVQRSPEDLTALAELLTGLEVHRVVAEASGGYERAVLAALRGLVHRRLQLVDAIGADTKRRRGATVAARDSIERRLRFMRAEQRLVKQQINAIVASAAEVREVSEAMEQTVGVGRVTAATLAVQVPELGRATRRAVAALVGVAPYNRDSGTSSGHRYIHGGRVAARKVLYMAALSAIVHGSPPMKALQARLRAKAKSAEVAIVACMRKLLIQLNSTVRRLRFKPAGST